MYQQREKIVHSRLWNLLMNNHCFILEWEHRHWREVFCEEHNDTYYDLPSTFLLDEFAFKSRPQTQNGPLGKFRAKECELTYNCFPFKHCGIMAYG